jgi:UDP-3-O-[3-hydroxymyristoyl] glucosamine N-acyltransferase
MAVQARLADLAQLLAGELVGDPSLIVTRIGALQGADGTTISFLANPRYQTQMAASAAACVIVAPAMREAALARGAVAGGAAAGGGPSATLICADPYLAYARLTQWWAAQSRPAAVAGVHASAVVEPGALIHPSASVGAFAFVGAGAQVAAGAVVGVHGYLGAGAAVGEHSVLKPRVTLGDNCRIGARALLHSGVVIGADGFGFAPTGKANVESESHWEKIEQLGAVWIGDDVEIGANTCVDRGALEDTVIEHGVKLDNLVQIGHNVRVGAHSAFAGCVGVAGSARIGRHCTAGGGAIILGHLEIADHVHITAATVVSRSIHKAGVYSGSFPFDDNASWEKNAATLRQLHTLRERLRTLEKAAAEKNK